MKKFTLGTAILTLLISTAALLAQEPAEGPVPPEEGEARELSQFERRKEFELQKQKAEFDFRQEMRKNAPFTCLRLATARTFGRYDWLGIHDIGQRLWEHTPSNGLSQGPGSVECIPRQEEYAWTHTIRIWDTTIGSNGNLHRYDIRG